MLKVITTRSDADEVPTIGTTLDDLAREGARRMIAVALQLEAAEYVTRFREARDECGHALVVRNDTARPRPVTTGVGPLTIAAPRVNDRGAAVDAAVAAGLADELAVGQPDGARRRQFTASRPRDRFRSLRAHAGLRRGLLSLALALTAHAETYSLPSGPISVPGSVGFAGA